MLDLHGDRNNHLGLGLAAVNAALDATHVSVIDLDVTGQSLAARADHRRAVAVQHRPRGLVEPQSQRVLDPQR